MRAASYIAAARKLRDLAGRIETTANAETPREKQARTRAVNAAAHAARLLVVKNAKLSEPNMITNVELNESGTAKFNAFFERHAKPGTNMQAVCFDLLDKLLDRTVMGESLHYELHRQHTTSGNPEILSLEPADIEITEAPDDE